jgi:NitT/TauT family transport system substrate-binding protein
LKKKTIFLLAAIGLAILGIAIFFLLHSPWDQQPEPEPVTLRLGNTYAITEALVHIAREEEFFTQHGLDIELAINETGAQNLTAILQGDIDIGGAMTTPLVQQAMLRDDFAIIAKVHFSEPFHYGVGRKDSGITSDPRSIIGKRIACVTGTSSHFNFDSWLLFDDISTDQFELIDINPSEALTAIQSGDIDGMFYWFPFNAMAEQALGDNAVVFMEKNFVPNSWVYVARKEYIQENPEVIERFVAALAQAEQFYDQQPQIALADHNQYTDLPADIIEPLFAKMNFKLVLDQALLLDLEYQTEWMVLKGYIEDTPLPNYLDFIYTDGLQEVKPAAVTIMKD